MKKRIFKISKWVVIVPVIIVLIYLIAFKTRIFLADIRPDELKENFELKNEGLGYLENSQLAHGSAIWKAQDSLIYDAQIKFIDTKAWFLISPVSEDHVYFKYISNPQLEGSSYFHSIESTTEFSIKKTELGIEKVMRNETTYDDFGSTFFYWGMQHLLEFPYKMNTADILEYLGTDTWEGKEYDLVFATWGDLTPSLETDQCIVWINKRTGLIDRFDSTGRDLSPWAVAQVVYEYVEKEGYTYPASIKVLKKSSGDPIMELEIGAITLFAD